MARMEWMNEMNGMDGMGWMGWDETGRMGGQSLLCWWLLLLVFASVFSPLPRTASLQETETTDRRCAGLRSRE